MNSTDSLYQIDTTEIIVTDFSPQKAIPKNTLSSSIKEYDPTDDVLFNNIAHELRTPINVVLGSIQLFEMMGDDLFLLYNRNKLKTYNNLMKQNCYRLLRTVDNLIDISRIQSENFYLFVANHDLVSVVKEITNKSKAYAARKGLTLKFHTYNRAIVTAFDEAQLSRALLNLISNAIKFTPRGGSINVSIIKKADRVYIGIKDTGIGIPADQLDNIFKRFAQVDNTLSRSHEGGGIGLSLASSIVRLHEGSISVKSKLGKGSIFTIELPVKKILDDKSKENNCSELNLSHGDKVNIELSDLTT